MPESFPCCSPDLLKSALCIDYALVIAFARIGARPRLITTFQVSIASDVLFVFCLYTV